MKRKMCLGGGLLLVASSAVITLAACSSFNLHKDNVIRNVTDDQKSITVNGNRNFKYFDPSTDTLTEGNYLIGGEIGTDLYFAQKFNSGNNFPAKIAWKNSDSVCEIFKISKEVTISIISEKSTETIISLDKGIYKPGDEVNFRALVISKKDNTPVVSNNVSISIYDGNNNRVYFEDVTTSEFGICFRKL